MAAEKPTIFFVHGAWHQSRHYDPIVQKLAAAGFPAVCPTLPTFNCTGAALKTLTLYDDADFIKNQLSQLVEKEEREVIAVLHSYGGVIGTQACDARFSTAARTSQGKKGGILSLVYMAAFVLPPNASLGDALGGQLPPFIAVHEDGSCEMDDPSLRFYSNLDHATAQKWAALTTPHVAQSQLNPITYTAYLHHPLVYIVATQDAALMPEIQHKMLASLTSSGLKVDVYELAADHSPYLCKEAEVIDILVKTAERYSVVPAA